MCSNRLNISLPILGVVVVASLVMAPQAAVAAGEGLSSGSITDTTLAWPTWQQAGRALSLRDYNTRVVVLGTTLLGLAAGIVGTFAYLRKRAMLGDALSHATLPGIALAFLLVQQKDLGWLLLGATITGVLGVLAVVAMRTIPRIREDAAIGIVLSVFFGAGMVLMSLIQQSGTGEEAGLSSFIYGQAAAMLRRDAYLIGGVASLVVLASFLLFKEFRLLCFDQSYAAAQGWPVLIIDLLLMSLVVLTTVVGLQAVGLILVVALLIIPAAAARFWTDRLMLMTVLAGVFGGVSGWLGSTISALTPRLPAGAVIVITTGLIFLISMFLAPHRGVVATVLRRWGLSRRIAYQNLLRALGEAEEAFGHGTAIPAAHLLGMRSWSRQLVRRLVDRACGEKLVTRQPGGLLALTHSGRQQARRILRNNRLWEVYLLKYADIAPSHIDREVDQVEHVLAPEVIAELEEVLVREHSPYPRGGEAPA